MGKFSSALVCSAGLGFCVACAPVQPQNAPRSEQPAQIDKNPPLQLFAVRADGSVVTEVDRITAKEREVERLKRIEQYRDTPFIRCQSCHSIQSGTVSVGPPLAGLFGRKVASEQGYRYSTALTEEDFTWNADRLDRWLADPRKMVPGTKMAFAGLKRSEKRAEVIEWLRVQTQVSQGSE